MRKMRLTVAFDSYDYLQPLREGKVQVDGLDLIILTVRTGIRHHRMYHYGEYDACEFGMSPYLVARAQDIDWLQAIPFFPRRMFGHKFCFLRADSSCKRPKDLKGCRVGLRFYENTLALMVRGMFMHNYDLPVDEVTWVCAGRGPIASTPPSRIRIEHMEGGRKLHDLLVAGEIDALVEPDLPEGWLSEKGSVKRLFPDFEKEEREYYKKTRVFPIMHPMVIKKEILERDPWVATSLFEALKETQRLYGEFMEQPHRLSFAWGRSYLEEERAFFGRDPFPQGLRDNRHDLETMIQFAQEQGMLVRVPTMEELFTENTRDS